jgi:uncharacterized integral membrane protein
MQRLGRFIWLIATMLLVTVAIAFATSNEAMIALYLWPFDGALTAPLWLVVVSSFIIGGLLSMLLMSVQSLAIRARLWHLEVKFNRLELNKGQQQSIARTPRDRQANGFHTVNYAPDSNIQGQEAKTVLSEPLRVDRTLR